VQRLIEALISIPFLVLALIAIAAAGPEVAGNPVLVILVVALVYAPRIARMARAAALDIVTRDYVMAARLRGARRAVVRARCCRTPAASSWSVALHRLRPCWSPGFQLGCGHRPRNGR
jgi:peptide/nickel transport system permease protein